MFNTSTAYSLLYDRLLIALRSMAVHRIWSMVLGYFLHQSLLHLTRQLSREMRKKTINSIWCQYLGKKQWAKTLHHTMHYQNTIWKKNNCYPFYRKMIWFIFQRTSMMENYEKAISPMARNWYGLRDCGIVFFLSISHIGYKSWDIESTRSASCARKRYVSSIQISCVKRP